MPHSSKKLDISPVPYVHPIPYSKFVQYKPLPDASGWDDDYAVIKIFCPNWCKNAPKLVVLRSVEQSIEKKKQQLECDETHDCGPYLQEMVLHSLHMVSILLNPEYKQKTIWYQDKLWELNVCTVWEVWL